MSEADEPYDPLSVPCSTCGAETGTPCVTRIPGGSHAARTPPLRSPKEREAAMAAELAQDQAETWHSVPLSPRWGRLLERCGRLRWYAVMESASARPVSVHMGVDAATVALGRLAARAEFNREWDKAFLLAEVEVDAPRRAHRLLWAEAVGKAKDTEGAECEIRRMLVNALDASEGKEHEGRVAAALEAFDRWKP